MKRSVVSGKGGFVSQFTDTSHAVDMEQWNDGSFYASISTNIIDGHFVSNDTNWHLYTVVYDGTQTGNANRLKIYMDGAQQTLTFDGTIPATIPTITGDLFIGHTFGAASNYTTGSIDDVRIYNRALSAQEVQQLYAMGK